MRLFNDEATSSSGVKCHARFCEPGVGCQDVLELRLRQLDSDGLIQRPPTTNVRHLSRHRAGRVRKGSRKAGYTLSDGQLLLTSGNGLQLLVYSVLLTPMEYISAVCDVSPRTVSGWRRGSDAGSVTDLPGVSDRLPSGPSAWTEIGGTGSRYSAEIRYPWVFL